jgi:Sulfotransferase domain
MQVIGAGFGRTGTSSLKAALERLGYGPCYHMSELVERPQDGPLWLAAQRRELADWDELLGDYQSTTDFPGCVFWPELIAAYPDAKVILTVRDSERWYESVQNTVVATMRSARELGDQNDIPDFGPPPHMMDVIRTVIASAFGDRIDDREHAIEAFERHNQRVREGVSPEQLLVYEVKQGWEPLCEFLGVEVPDEPFPHLNDAAEFVQRLEERGAQLAEGGTA